jgi:hypothetical protein
VRNDRFTSGSVTVIGRPSRNCCSKIGSALPLDPSTLPNRMITNFVLDPSASASMNCSATSFEAPITLDGFTALSVESDTKTSTPCSAAASASVAEANALFSIASIG